MAELWEISAVIAMRDLQWLFAPPGGLPNAAINLAGKAESRLGDEALMLGGRFFLFEIKPQSSKFSSEWKLKDRGDGKKRTKNAYASVIKIAGKLDANPSSPKAMAEALRSLRCHHFAYWHVGNPYEMQYRLCLQPYLRAVLGGGLFSHGLRRAVDAASAKLLLGYAPKGVNSDGGVDFARCTSATVAAAHQEQLGIVDARMDHQPYDWYPLGLEVAAFQSYVDFLMANAPGGEEPINTIAISTCGWQRILRTTSDLGILLEDLSRVAQRLDSEGPKSGPGFSKKDPKDAFAAVETKNYLRAFVAAEPVLEVDDSPDDHASSPGPSVRPDRHRY